MRKKLGWAVIFLSLLLMTVITVSDLFGSGVNSALANVIKENKGNKFAVIGAANGNGFMKKINSMMDAEVLCSVNEAQLETLSASYDVFVDEIIVDGEVITLAKLGGDKIKRKDILSYLESSGSADNCKTVKSHKWYYLLFSANVS